MTIGSTTRDGLIAGNYPLEADEVTVIGAAGDTPTEFLRGDVVGLTEEGNAVLVDSTAEDGSENAVGIMCDNITATPGETVVTTMYIKGEFNHRYLRFGGTDTSDTHRRRMTEIGMIIRESRI